MMRNLVKNQWCAAHNGTITMKDVKAMNKRTLIEEYEYICRRLEQDRLLSAQYNLFRPKPAITEPPSKRQRVERVSSQPTSVPAATTLPADDPDSVGGVTDSTVTTTAAMDSAGTRRKFGDSAGTATAMVSPFADSAAGPSPFLSSIAARGINAFFLESDEEVAIESASSPPRSRRKHLGVRSDDFLWDKPVEDFFSSESESDDDMENYIPPLPYGAFKDWILSRCGLELWRDVNMLCQSLHSDDVEDFWRTQDEWIVSSWQLYPKSSVHAGFDEWETVYMFVDKSYPIRNTACHVIQKLDGITFSMFLLGRKMASPRDYALVKDFLKSVDKLTIYYKLVLVFTKVSTSQDESYMFSIDSCCSGCMLGSTVSARLYCCCLGYILSAGYYVMLLVRLFFCLHLYLLSTLFLLLLNPLASRRSI
ncbi:hypothetical protein Tco_1420879 [Tanacetum coccineum]